MNFRFREKTNTQEHGPRKSQKTSRATLLNG